MLEINNVTYSYPKSKSVFDDFSLSFTEGGVYGLLGKNGTGKSTLLYLIMGLLHPQSGVVLMDGVDTRLRRPDVLADMFLLPEEYDLPAVTLDKYITLVKSFYPRFSEEILERCLATFELPRDVKLNALSMGQKKKAYLCIALATQCRLLLLDEPTNGLDIPSKSQFRKVIAGNVSDEQIIIISTHQVHDVEHLLDHVTLIDNNCILLHDRMDALGGEDGVVDLEQLFNEKIEK